MSGSVVNLRAERLIQTETRSTSYVIKAAKGEHPVTTRAKLDEALEYVASRQALTPGLRIIEVERIETEIQARKRFQAVKS